MIDVLAHNHAPDETWVLEWLSSPRLQTYLDASGTNLQRALRLYEWNINLGQTLMKDIAFFEVALRNAYNREIDSRWDGTRHWLFDDDSPVNIPIPRHNRAGKSFDANALNRTSIRNATPSRTETIQPDKMIANPPLGFWAHLTDKAHERILWIPYLHHAWPSGTNRADLNAKIRLINECRNRIAHHEPLFHNADGTRNPAVVDGLVVDLFHELLPQADVFEPDAPTPVELFSAFQPTPLTRFGTFVPRPSADAIPSSLTAWIDRYR